MKIFFITNIYKKEEKKDIERLKAGIEKLGFKDYEIYVHDGVVDNRGYAYGINRGIKKGLKNGADIFVVFNSDISLNRLTKKMIINGLSYYDILGFSVKQQGKIYYGGKIDKWRLSGGLIPEKPKNKYSSVDFVSGSLMFIKKQVIEKVGLWDESYFFYYDEVDYCYRAKQAGFKTGIDSDHYYNHFEYSQTHPKKNYFLAKNRFKFFCKFAGFKQKVYELLRVPKTFIEYLPLLFSLSMKSKFLTNLFSLNLSSLLNKLFHFVLFIFLVRNLSPDQYGIYIIVWAFVGIFNPLIDLGTTNYGLVYLPKEKTAMINHLISMRFYVAGFIFSATILSALFFFQTQPEIFLYICLTSVVILSNVWSGSYLIINSVTEKIYYSSLVSLIFNFIYISIVIAGLFLKKDLITVFLIIFICFLVYSFVNFLLVKKEVKNFKLTLNFSVWKKVLAKSYIFVLISFVAGLYFKQNVFLLKHFQSESAVGVYSSGYKFLDALLLLAASYNITVTPIFSKLAKHKHMLYKKIFKDIILLCVLGISVAIIFYFFAPLVLPLILKGRYLSGIKVAQVVILALPFILISSIFYNLLYVFEMARYVFYIFLIQIIFNTLLNLLFIPVYSYFASAWITVLSEIISMVLALYFVRLHLKKL